MSAKGNSRHFRSAWGAGSRVAVLAAAARVANVTGLSVGEVMARRKAGLKYCGDHGWEDREAARLCHNARCLARHHAKRGQP